MNISGQCSVEASAMTPTETLTEVSKILAQAATVAPVVIISSIKIIFFAEPSMLM